MHLARLVPGLGLLVHGDADAATDGTLAVAAAEDTADGAAVDLHVGTAAHVGRRHSAVAAAEHIAYLVAAVDRHVGIAVGDMCRVAAAVDVFNAVVAVVHRHHRRASGIVGLVAAAEDGPKSVCIRRGRRVGAVDIDVDSTLRSTADVVAAIDSFCHRAAVDVDSHSLGNVGGATGTVAATIERAVDGAAVEVHGGATSEHASMVAASEDAAVHRAALHGQVYRTALVLAGAAIDTALDGGRVGDTASGSIVTIARDGSNSNTAVRAINCSSENVYGGSLVGRAITECSTTINTTFDVSVVGNNDSGSQIYLTRRTTIAESAAGAKDIATDGTVDDGVVAIAVHASISSNVKIRGTLQCTSGVSCTVGTTGYPAVDFTTGEDKAAVVGRAAKCGSTIDGASYGTTFNANL